MIVKCRSRPERIAALVASMRGHVVPALLNSPDGEAVTPVRVLGRIRTISATWDPDADDGNGAPRCDELRLVRVHVCGESAPRSICVERLLQGVV